MRGAREKHGIVDTLAALTLVSPDTEGTMQGMVGWSGEGRGEGCDGEAWHCRHTRRSALVSPFGTGLR